MVSFVSFSSQLPCILDARFHLHQSIHRKIKDLGLANGSLQNKGICDQCRQLMTLTLRQINEADHQFQRLKTIMPTAFSDLTTYFKYQWLYGIVPTQMWNFHTTLHRTNNLSEGKLHFFPFFSFSIVTINYLDFRL